MEDDAALFAAAMASLDAPAGPAQAEPAAPAAAPTPAAAPEAPPAPQGEPKPEAAPEKPEGEAAPAEPAVSIPAREAAERVRAQLAERKAAREAKQRETTLETRIAEIEKRPAQETARAPSEAEIAHRLRTDPIAALEALGIDPLEHHERFRVAAKDRKATAAASKQDETARELQELKQELKQEREQRERLEQAKVQTEKLEAAKREFLAKSELKDGEVNKFPLLARLKPERRVQRALALANDLHKDGNTDVDDVELCSLLEAELTDELDGLLPANTQVESHQAPGPRGTTQQTTGKPPSTLRNDLAAQRPGKQPVLTDDELYDQAMKLLEA